jgi:hypothetical protein
MSFDDALGYGRKQVQVLALDVGAVILNCWPAILRQWVMLGWAWLEPRSAE